MNFVRWNYWRLGKTYCQCHNRDCRRDWAIFLLSTHSLEKTNHLIVCNFFDETLSIFRPYGIKYNDVLLFISGMAPCTIQCEKLLYALYPKMVYVENEKCIKCPIFLFFKRHYVIDIQVTCFEHSLTTIASDTGYTRWGYATKFKNLLLWILWINMWNCETDSEDALWKKYQKYIWKKSFSKLLVCIKPAFPNLFICRTPWRW